MPIRGLSCETFSEKRRSLRPAALLRIYSLMQEPLPVFITATFS